MGRIRVHELELLEGPRGLAGCGGYSAVRILVRRAGRPLAWVQLSHTGADEVAAERIALAIHSLSLNEEQSDFARANRGAAREDVIACPGISVVIATRDRPVLLRACVESVLSCRYPEFEVLVIDSAPADGAAHSAIRDLPARYVREQRPGVAAARNRGLNEARHELIAFIDDDARADADWLRAIAGSFADPDIAAVTGLIAPAELETEAQQLFELACGGMGKGLLPRIFRRADLSLAARIRVQEAGAGANMAFRRAVLEDLGGFDSELGTGTAARGGEDLEMLHRVIESGYTLRYEPAALVWHVHRRERAALLAQLRATGRSFGAYLLTVRRSSSIGVAALWLHGWLPWVAWLLARFPKRLIGKHSRPTPLLWAELAGAFSLITQPLAKAPKNP